MKPRVRLLFSIFAFVFAFSASAGPTHAELSPEWVARLNVGAALTAGLQGMVTDAAGVSYVTGVSGSSSNTDITTAAFAPDGTMLWSQVFNGPEDWHDQARGITLGPGGVLWVTGNTPGPSFHSNVLLLKYDAVSGTLLDTIQYSSAPFTAEYGASVAADAVGDVYVGGGTVGDGGDALIMKFDVNGQFLWKRTWDGPAASPFSGDSVQEILVDADGDLLVMIHGVMSSLHADYVVIKYAAANGSTLWEANWGESGEDSPNDMEVDAKGDVYVTGTALDFQDKYSTIKLRGLDGKLIWQVYDAAGIDDSGTALELVGTDDVYVTGRVDPDGDNSNFNDNIYTVKRDARTGAFEWSHLYGANCVGCFDVPTDVRVDPNGHVFVAGSTSSPPYGGDVILLVLDEVTGAETDRGIVSGGASEHAGSGVLHFDAAFNLYDGGNVGDFNTGQVDMSVTKWASLTGAGIPCGDIRNLRTRCVDPGSGNKLQLRLTLTDTSHDGEQVTVAVDGEEHLLTIFGRRAGLSVSGASSGPHTVELTEPAGCFPEQVAVCP